MGFYAVTQGDDGVEVIEICLVFLAVSGSCKEFLYNCMFIPFSFGKDVFQVLSDVLLTRLKQLGHMFLAELDCLILELDFKAGNAIFGLVDQEF